MNLDSPSRLVSLRDQWGYPILWDQPDGQRWFQIFNSSSHWWLHTIQLAYPDGTMVTMPGRGIGEWPMSLPISARFTYRVIASMEKLKQLLRRLYRK